MRRTLGILLLLAPLALAGEVRRDPFPSDFQPAECADVTKVCRSFPQSQMADIAAIRGFDIGQEWIDAHWEELMTALEPTCAKIATCFATPGNDYLFCNDIVAEEVFAVCNRYPAGSEDRNKCRFFMTAWLQGHDRNSRPEWEAMQACALPKKTATERTFDAWIDTSRPGQFTVYAIDAETRVPVQAPLKIQAAKPVYAEDVPNGLPTANYPVKWAPRLVRVTNAQGHHDLVPPQVQIEKEGYRTATLTIPMTVPSLKVEMTPAPAKLKRGKNLVTITAVDAATGKPADLRVMAGEIPAGKTNVPFELELARGSKRPEIWITSLYDAYSDVVVAPGQ